MWERVACSEDRLCMVLMLLKRRSLRPGHATAGPSGGGAAAVALERRRRAINPRRKRNPSSSGGKMMDPLCLRLMESKRVQKVCVGDIIYFKEVHICSAALYANR
jgi:hypothetical protein